MKNDDDLDQAEDELPDEKEEQCTDPEQGKMVMRHLINPLDLTLPEENSALNHLRTCKACQEIAELMKGIKTDDSDEDEGSIDSDTILPGRPND